MSFQTDIKSIMNSNVALNALVDGIYFDALPNNFDLKKDWIVYTFKEAEHFDVLGTKNVLTSYSLFAKVISPDTSKLLEISDALNNFIISYTSTKVLCVSFVTDNHTISVVDDMDIYENVLEYTIAYVN